MIQQIAGRCNRVINESMPIVDARLENGARVNAVISPVALNGPILTIRRFPDKPITMDRLIALNSISRECADFLAALVAVRYSMIIGGGTGSGKTTFLGALSDFIPRDERIITIEDNAELKLQGVDNLVRLEAKMANTEGASSISIRDLIRTALRMRPDRIIVGEVRGGETVDMLQALNTGHEGSLSTAHANSSRDMLSRLETMILIGSKASPGSHTETDCLRRGYSYPPGTHERQIQETIGDYRNMRIQKQRDHYADALPPDGRQRSGSDSRASKQSKLIRAGIDL